MPFYMEYLGSEELRLFVRSARNYMMTSLPAGLHLLSLLPSYLYNMPRLLRPGLFSLSSSVCRKIPLSYSRFPSQTSYLVETTRAFSSSPLRSNTNTMTSATTFYNFEPIDSAYLPSHPGNYKNMLTKNRNGQTLPPHQPQRQGHSGREHRLQMRLHPPIPRPRDALQIRQRQAPGGLHHSGLPLQPIWQPGPRLQR